MTSPEKTYFEIFKEEDALAAMKRRDEDIEKQLSEAVITQLDWKQNYFKKKMKKTCSNQIGQAYVQK